MQIQNVTITHRKDNRLLLDHFTLSIQRGDTFAVIGEEGNGKSTLLQCLYDPKRIASYAEVSGHIDRQGQWIGYLPQEMPAANLAQTVYEYCCTHPAFGEQSPKELSQLARPMELPSDFFYQDTPLRALSGGERIKLQLACLQMSRPDILLLDEPSNDLDLSTLRWLETFLLNFSGGILFISHDETLLSHTANGIIHLEQLRHKRMPRATVQRCSYDAYLAARETTMAHQAQLAKNERNAYAKQMQKLQQIQQKVTHQQNTISRQEPYLAARLKKKAGTVKTQRQRIERQAAAFTAFPESEDAILLTFRHPISLPPTKTILRYDQPLLQVGEKTLATHLHLEIRGAQKVGLIGKNGIGKSTLLAEIAQQLRLRTDIRVFYLPQQYEALLSLQQTPIDFLRQNGDKAEETQIRTYLGSLKFTADEMTHAIEQLSGGQKAKLCFLKAVLHPYDVLLLDEPTRNFSPLSRPVLTKLLRQFPGAILTVSHDRTFLLGVCDICYQLQPDGLRLYPMEQL